MRIFTEEHKRKLCENHKGMLDKKHSEATKQKMRIARVKRPDFSDEQKQDISKKISKTHKNVPKSESHKIKISESEKDKIVSESIRKKISMSLKNVPKTEEHRKNISKGNMGRQGMIGKDNPNWKGGISCEPYCDIWLDKEYKESIKERDNFTCQNCLSIENLCPHHINYDKKDCKPDNLITLCRSCNSKANFNREYWQEYYTTLNEQNKKNIM